jgi:subtilisin family serine protease
MQRSLHFLVVFFFSLAMTAQLSKFNAALTRETSSPANFPKIYTVLVKGDVEKIKFSQRNYGLKLNYSSGNICSVTGSLANLVFIANTNMVQRMELVKSHFQLMNDTMRVKNNINEIHAGQSPLASSYTGKGVIMGIIDSGIDFNAPDFKDSLGRSRILYIWDQNFPVAANTPAPYGYGQEWDSSYFNNNTCPHTDLAYFGHGTHTAGIAGARGEANGAFKGVAPEVEFIVVAMDFNSGGPTISDAADYIYAKAAALGRPCVINASVGDYYGSHDGKDLQAQLIKAMLQTPGRLFAGSAGNAAAYAFHLGYPVTADTNFTWIVNGSNPINFQVYAEVNDFMNVNYSIGVNHPSNLDYKGNIGFKDFNYCLGSISADTIFNNGNRIGIVQATADTAMGVYTLDVMINPDSGSYLWTLETFGLGRIDSWNFSYIAAGLPTNLQYPRMDYYKPSDTLQTMVSGFQCLDEVMTVGNYLNMNQWYNVSNTLVTIPQQVNEISGSSSHGPTRDNRVKPDIAATGDQIFATAVLAMIPNLVSGAPDAVSPDSMHVMGGGTSSSSPVVAGLGALFLEMDPTANWWLFRQAVTACAKQDSFTGSSLPDPVWGYGKLNGFAAMTCTTLGQNNTSVSDADVKVFPNPATTEVNFYFPANNGIGTVLIYDATGRKVMENKTMLYGSVKTDLSSLSAGIYFYTVFSKFGTANNGKIIIE